MNVRECSSPCFSRNHDACFHVGVAVLFAANAESFSQAQALSVLADGIRAMEND